VLTLPWDRAVALWIRAAAWGVILVFIDVPWLCAGGIIRADQYRTDYLAAVGHGCARIIPSTLQRLRFAGRDGTPINVNYGRPRT
jgi:hypothetical protein